MPAAGKLPRHAPQLYLCPPTSSSSSLSSTSSNDPYSLYIYDRAYPRLPLYSMHVRAHSDRHILDHRSTQRVELCIEL